MNFCPSYAPGETPAIQKETRVALLSEVKKRNNEQNVALMIEKTFAHRRQELVQEEPMVADFKTRWPALFSEREVIEQIFKLTAFFLMY